MAHKRKVTKEGRVNIPVEYMEDFGIKVEDWVDVSSTEEGILIKKFVDRNYCVITQKVFPSKELHKVVGDVYISNEGISLISAILNKLK